MAFEASFTHADELGGELTALIDSVETHLLVHDVLVDLNGRDSILDFLAEGVDEAGDDAVWRIFESDHTDAVVEHVSADVSLRPAGVSNGRQAYELVVPPTVGPLYLKRPFPAGRWLDPDTAVRLVDGKRIHVANIWVSRERDEDRPAEFHYFLNLFDINGGGVYAVEFAERAAGGNEPPVLSFIGDKRVRLGDALGLGFTVLGSDPNGSIPHLTVSGLPPGAQFATVTNGSLAQGSFFWRPTSTQIGIHSVLFVASDGQASDREDVQIFVDGMQPALRAYHRPPWSYAVDVYGEPGQTYIVEYRSVLAGGDWVELGAVTLPEDSHVQTSIFMGFDENMFYLRVRSDP